MNQLLAKRSPRMRFRVPVILFSAASALLTLAGILFWFVYSYRDYYGELNIEFYMPDIWNLLLDSGSVLIRLLPCLLLILFAAVLCKYPKLTFAVPVIFLTVSAGALYEILHFVLQLLLYHYELSFIGWFYYVGTALNLLTAIAFALVIIQALKGFSKKYLLIIAFVVGIIVKAMQTLVSLRSIRFYLFEGYYFDILGPLVSFAAVVALYFALLFLGLNRLHRVFPVSAQKADALLAVLSPEEGLRLLKEQYNFGKLTEEEYRAKRLEILSRL